MHCKLTAKQPSWWTIKYLSTWSLWRALCLSVTHLTVPVTRPKIAGGAQTEIHALGAQPQMNASSSSRTKMSLTTCALWRLGSATAANAMLCPMTLPQPNSLRRSTIRPTTTRFNLANFQIFQTIWREMAHLCRGPMFPQRVSGQTSNSTSLCHFSTPSPIEFGCPQTQSNWSTSMPIVVACTDQISCWKLNHLYQEISKVQI